MTHATHTHMHHMSHIYAYVSCPTHTCISCHTGASDEEQRLKLIKQLQATMAALDSSVGLEKERQDAALQQV